MCAHVQPASLFPKPLPLPLQPLRVYADGVVEYLHPKDGVYSEKVNAGRKGENQNMRKIGDNVDPIKVCLWGGVRCACMPKNMRAHVTTGHQVNKPGGEEFLVVVLVPVARSR